MIRIRLRKTGRKRINTFQIIVIDSRKHRDSQNEIALLGYYRPQFKNDYGKINAQIYDEWVSKGAQPTDRVKKIYQILTKQV